jgi:hypothetical protein
MAAAFGASAATDAFNVAFRIPNLLRRLFAEGGFSQAFVPLLAASRERDGDAHVALALAVIEPCEHRIAMGGIDLVGQPPHALPLGGHERHDAPRRLGRAAVIGRALPEPPRVARHDGGLGA